MRRLKILEIEPVVDERGQTDGAASSAVTLSPVLHHHHLGLGRTASSLPFTSSRAGPLLSEGAVDRRECGAASVACRAVGRVCEAAQRQSLGPLRAIARRLSFLVGACVRASVVVVVVGDSTEADRTTAFSRHVGSVRNCARGRVRGNGSKGRDGTAQIPSLAAGARVA